MANHGAVAYGSDLWKHLIELETLEHTARFAILSRALGGSRNLPLTPIEKLINVREAAGYLDQSARCQACGYLHETSLACPTGDRPQSTRYVKKFSENGERKVLLAGKSWLSYYWQALEGVDEVVEE